MAVIQSPRACEVCDTIFVPVINTRASGKYCSLTCSRRFCNSQRAEYKPKIEKVCQHCNKVFKVPPSKIYRKHCSRSCKVTAQFGCQENRKNIGREQLLEIFDKKAYLMNLYWKTKRFTTQHGLEHSMDDFLQDYYECLCRGSFPVFEHSLIRTMLDMLSGGVVGLDKEHRRRKVDLVSLQAVFDLAGNQKWMQSIGFTEAIIDMERLLSEDEIRTCGLYLAGYNRTEILHMGYATQHMLEEIGKRIGFVWSLKPKSEHP